ncbi:hypothetical protein A244_07805 [Pseudomonas syringae pv. actinidiae ICMP 18807]|uniref:YD repeat-containing protein n=2 Tax=Pseudomonas syringae TaxID=317 RepID=S6V0V6_PSESF|nr:hypothetical protein A244_07805 [Pseudomonas syringae pv. actinidiae ICMP 18807]
MPTGRADIQRFYQKNRLATEIQGALLCTVFQHEDLLLAQQRRVDGVLETTLLATDQQRSVLQLVDKAGTEPIAYSPYGHHPAESGLTSLLGFNGERRDPVTGHYLLGNGYRAYNPVLMRFNSPDSLSPFDEGGLNAYGYVGGDPVGFVDETGHIGAGLLRKLLTTSKIIRKPKQSPLSRLSKMVNELPSSSTRIYQDIVRPSASRAAVPSPRTPMTSALQASVEGRPTVTFPHMTVEYRLQKTLEFSSPIDTIVPASFREAEVRLQQHSKRRIEVGGFVSFHKANAEVNGKMSIVAGSSKYYEFIYSRDNSNLEVYRAGMFLKHSKAMLSAIRKQN